MNLDEKKALLKKARLKEVLRQQSMASPEANVPVPPEMSQLESAGLGLAQGATLGGADELEGAIRGSPAGAFKSATEGFLGKDVSQDPDVQKYVEARDIARQRYKEAEEANPKTYLAGQIGGGLASSFIPGAASVRGAAALGLGAGVLSSGADLSKGQGEDLAKEALISSALGAGTAAIPAAIGKAKDLGILGNPIKAFQRGLKGENLIGDTARKEIGENLVQVAGELGQTADTAGSKLGQLKQKLLNEQTGPVDLSGLSDTSKQIIGDIQTKLPEGIKDQKSIANLLEASLQNPDMQLTPKQADQLRKDLADMGYNGKILTSKQGEDVAKRLTGKTSEILNEQVPGLKPINEDIQSAKRASDIFNVSGKGADEFGYEKKLTPLIQKLETDSGASDVARAQFKEGMEQLAKVAPDKAQQLAQKAQDASEKFDLAKTISSQGAGGMKLFGIPTAAGNAAGQALNKVTGGLTENEGFRSAAQGMVTKAFQTAAPIAETATASDIENQPTAIKSQNLYSLSNDNYMKLADKFAKDPSTAQYGEELSKAIQNKNNARKNAILFTIMQRPDLRSKLEDQ